MGFPRLLKGILSSHDTEPAGILGGLYTLLWGAWLLKPGSTFETSIVYAAMSKIATEEIWGGTITSLGIMTLVGIAYHLHRVRLMTSMLNCALWLFLAVLFGITSSWQAAGVPHFLLMGIASGWVHIRLTDT